MKAVVVNRHGPPEALSVAEIRTPQPAPRQVRVRVHAGGVQPFDSSVRRGQPGFRMQVPHQLGNEFAGRIDALGDGVTGWSVGEQVLGWAAMRSLAEYVIADDDALVAKPSDMPWETAGALGASGQTALTALRELHVQVGTSLPIHAAAGGTGSMAVQLARHGGAHVIGTASEANHDYLRSLGATPVTYGPGLPDRIHALAPDGVDAVLDAVGGQALNDSLILGASKTRIGTLVDHARAEQLGVCELRAHRSANQLQQLTTLHDNGALRVTIRRKYPLDHIIDAHHDIDRGHGNGKIVITVADRS